MPVLCVVLRDVDIDYAYFDWFFLYNSDQILSFFLFSLVVSLIIIGCIFPFYVAELHISQWKVMLQHKLQMQPIS